MTIEIAPFGPEHVEQAAGLLAARQRHDRIQSPELPRRYEDPAAARDVLEEILAGQDVRGVAAVTTGTLRGFLLGAPEHSATDGAFAGLMRPRAVEIPYEGHAANPCDHGLLYRRMYAALAEQWLDSGLVAHYVNAPANQVMSDFWFDHGFGRVAELAVRGTSAPPERGTDPTIDVEIRRAGPDDEATVQTLLAEMLRAFAAPPVFVPFLPESERARQQFASELLADPACPIWLAVADGRVVGMQLFVEPGSPHWFVSTMRSPEACVYLFMACTAPDARGAGIGSALFTKTMSWAREAGYERCALHYQTASRAAIFWRNLGFQPVSQWLLRVVDERAIWAK